MTPVRSSTRRKPGSTGIALALVLFPAVASAGGPPAIGTVGLDPSFLAGADTANRPKVFAPNPLVGVSSISHWSGLATPNLLMEPFIDASLTSDIDLTDEAFADLGWPLGGGATVVIHNLDGPGEGFNDPSPPVLPAPGNPGATLGAQRLAVVEHAVGLWAAILQSPVPIEIEVNFDSLIPCGPGGALFGFAGPLSSHADFPGAPVAGTWYLQAQANALAGVDLSPSRDLFILFNSDLDTGCLGPGTGFYYGLDHAEPAGSADLLATALHEIGHGTGFATLVDLTTGSLLGPPFFPDAYTRRLLDLTSGSHWDEMTDAERLASSVNTDRVVFDGAAVAAGAPSVLDPRQALIVSAPASIAGSYEGRAANFGQPLDTPGVTGGLVCGRDDAGASPDDGCEPLVNAAEVAGNLALIDRGTCPFAQKASLAQAAGATGVIFVNNVAGDPPIPAGPEPSIVIPLLILRQEDGERIRSVACGGPSPLEIPAASAEGLSTLAVLLLAAGLLALRRRS